MKTQDRIRKAALYGGWTIKARVGDTHDYGRGGTYDSDIFVIGSVDRHLQDGTPVTEPEHTIRVWYRHDGAVYVVSAQTATVPQWIYHQGITSAAHERDKADRVIAALVGQIADIPSVKGHPETLPWQTVGNL